MILIQKQQKSALSLGKNDKYEHLTSQEELTSAQIIMIEQAIFIFSSLVKAFERQRKTIEDEAEKQKKNRLRIQLKNKQRLYKL